jgi:hypothetical protein
VILVPLTLEKEYALLDLSRHWVTAPVDVVTVVASAASIHMDRLAIPELEGVNAIGASLDNPNVETLEIAYPLISTFVIAR